MNPLSVLHTVSHHLAADLGDEMVVMHLPTRAVHNLRGVAADVWRLLAEPRRVDELVDVLLERYEIDAETCRRDVEGCLEQLGAAGLVEEGRSEPCCVGIEAPGGQGSTNHQSPITSSCADHLLPDHGSRITDHGFPTHRSPLTAHEGPAPDLSLVLWCCSRFLADRFPGKVEEPGEPPLQGVNWEHFCTLADGHGVIPQVCMALRGVAGVPESAAEKLQNRWREIAGRNLDLTAELLEILELFSAHGILAVPYKGPVLAHQLYRDVGLRQFEDLDLLVRWADVPAAREFLTGRGYEPLTHTRCAGDLAFFRMGGEHAMTDRGRGATVELRWQLMPRYYPFRLLTDEVLTRSMSMTFADRPIPVMPREYVQLLLAVHGSRHQWGRLEWLCDYAACMASADERTASAAIRVAQRSSAVNRLGLAAGMVSSCLGVHGDEAVAEEAGRSAKLQRTCARRLLGASPKRRTLESRLFEFGFLWRSLDLPRDRLTFAVMRPARALANKLALVQGVA